MVNAAMRQEQIRVAINSVVLGTSMMLSTKQMSRQLGGKVHSVCSSWRQRGECVLLEGVGCRVGHAMRHLKEFEHPEEWRG